MSYGKFAPSKDDVIGALMHFFGAPASPEKLADYTEHHAATYHFPDAFEGSNVRLRDVMSNLILRSPQVWQTSLGLPFQQLEGTVRCLPMSHAGATMSNCAMTMLMPNLACVSVHRPWSGTRSTSTSACCSACHVRFCRFPALRACGRRDSGSPSPNPARRRGRVADACVLLALIRNGANAPAFF